MKVTVIFWLLPAAISDVIIALALTYYLRQHKGRFQGSDKVLDKIIHSASRLSLQTIGSNSVHSDCPEWSPHRAHGCRGHHSLLHRIHSLPHRCASFLSQRPPSLTTFPSAFTFVLPKLYANTVLSSLCSRFVQATLKCLPVLTSH